MMKILAILIVVSLYSAPHGPINPTVIDWTRYGDAVHCNHTVSLIRDVFKSLNVEDRYDAFCSVDYFKGKE